MKLNDDLEVLDRGAPPVEVHAKDIDTSAHPYPCPLLAGVAEDGHVGWDGELAMHAHVVASVAAGVRPVNDLRDVIKTVALLEQMEVRQRWSVGRSVGTCTCRAAIDRSFLACPLLASQPMRLWHCCCVSSS
eukprot:SAG22_NODE_994_length_6119_cov_167.397674_6_plen_132_part_00